MPSSVAVTCPTIPLHEATPLRCSVGARGTDHSHCRSVAGAGAACVALVTREESRFSLLGIVAPPSLAPAPISVAAIAVQAGTRAKVAADAPLAVTARESSGSQDRLRQASTHEPVHPLEGRWRGRYGSALLLVLHPLMEKRACIGKLFIGGQNKSDGWCAAGRWGGIKAG